MPRIIEQFVVGLDGSAGQDFGAAIFGQRRSGEQPPNKSEAADNGAAVGLLAQIAGIDRRRLSGSLDLAST